MSNPEKSKNGEKPVEEPKKTEQSFDKIATQTNELGDYIQSSYQMVKDDLLGIQKSLKTTIIIKAVLMAFVILYMGWAYINISKIDAEAVVFTTKEQFIASLPQIAREVSDDLKAQAPKTIAEAKKSSLEMIPKLRLHLQENILTETKKMNDAIGADVETLFNEYVTKHADNIKQKKPDASDLEKARILVKMIRADYKDNVKKSIDKLLAEYSKDLKKLTFNLDKLSKGKNLTKEEQIQSKLVSAWAKLMKIKTKGFKPVDLEKIEEHEDNLVIINKDKLKKHEEKKAKEAKEEKAKEKTEK